MKLVVLFSGGLDSTTALYERLALGDSIQALGIHYGQRHKRELAAAAKIAERIKVPFQVVDLSALRPLISGNSQTDSTVPVPHGHYTEENMKATVVPNRNMIMLSIAMGFAISLKFDGVAYAAHTGDHTIYPDCRPEFVQGMQAVAKLCDWHSLEIITPFLQSSKADIVRAGVKLQVPFEDTWSCYEGGDLHCGKCGTCVERKEAFLLAKVPDPTKYREPNYKDLRGG
jgi:7-cyano-7-deazaguanine synthase